MKTTINPAIRHEIAEKFLLENAAGYSAEFQGSYYLVNGEQVMRRQSNAPWDPWTDHAAVISLDHLINEIGGARSENADFSDEDFDPGTMSRDEYDANAIDYVLGYIPGEYDQGVVDAQES